MTPGISPKPGDGRASEPTGSPAEAERPIACDMTALSAAERARYDSLRPRVLGAVDQVQETPTGFRLRIGSSTSTAAIAEWMDMEHRCCPFLDIDLALRADGTNWIQIGGSATIKAFLDEEFRSFRDSDPERKAR